MSSETKIKKMLCFGLVYSRRPRLDVPARDRSRWSHLRGIVRDGGPEGGQVLDVLVVEPLDLEVQVHVLGALAQSVLLVLCKHNKTE